MYISVIKAEAIFRQKAPGIIVRRKDILKLIASKRIKAVVKRNNTNVGVRYFILESDWLRFIDAVITGKERL